VMLGLLSNVLDFRFLTDFIGGVTGVVTAVTTLLAAVLLGLWPQVVALRKLIATRHRKKKASGSAPSQQNQPQPDRTVQSRPLFRIVLAGFCLTLFVAIMLVRSSPDSRTRRERLTSAACEAFARAEKIYDTHNQSVDKHLFERAIRFSTNVIAEYKGRAVLDQAALKNSPEPPSGRVSVQEKQTIFGRGVLNDVATCLFIQARALEYLGRQDRAKAIYIETATFTHARTWSPSEDLVWAPYLAALGRLHAITNVSSSPVTD
jgi:hypothetical protein